MIFLRGRGGKNAVEEPSHTLEGGIGTDWIFGAGGERVLLGRIVVARRVTIKLLQRVLITRIGL